MDLSTAAESARSGAEPRAHAGFWMIVAALVAAELTCALEFNMINTALAHLYRIYGDPLRVGWLITAFSLTAAASAAICSRLGDLFGRKRLLMIMLGVALTGSIVSALADQLPTIILGRALQGASMSVLPLAFGILRENATPRRLSLGIGMLGGTYSFSSGLGMLLGGVFVDTGPWQRMFLLSAGVAALALILVGLLLPGQRHPGRRGQRLDLAGGVLFVLPVAALLLGLGNAKTAGWAAPQTWGLILGGAAVLAAWVRHEARQTSPLIDVRLFQVRQVALVNLVIFFTSVGPLIYPLLFLPLLQQPLWTGIGFGVTATVAGLIKLPTNIGSGCAGIGAGYAASRWGMRRVIVIAAVANLLAWLLLIARHDSLVLIAAAAIMAISPAATVMLSCAPKLIIDAAPEDRTSEATGLTQVVRTIAMAIGAMMYALTLSSSEVMGADGARFPDERAYVTSFAAIAACCLAALAAALMIPRSADLNDRAHPAAQ